MITRTTIAALAALSILPACGGGGGGGSPSTPTNSGTTPPTVDGAFAAAPAEMQESVSNAATATARFGSVTQTSNVNLSGVSTDAAEVTLSGNTVHVRIRRQDGSTLSLNTADHTVEQSPVTVSPVTGREWQSAILLDHDANSLTAMRGVLDHDNFGDWMVGGYWLHIEGNWAAGNVTGIEVGAFVDGPEISAERSRLPGGTATYNGIAGGLYGTGYGTDADSPGAVELGEYEGIFRATADFSAGTISASISDVSVDGIFFEEPDGSREIVDGPSDLEVYFAATSMDSGGQFTGSGVTVAYPGLTFTSTEGSWSGRLSTIDDTSGNPRALAGTHGGVATTSGGTEVEFIGAHFAATGQY